MALMFDGVGYIDFAAPWIPSDPTNFEVEITVELLVGGNQAFWADQNDRNLFRILSGNLYISYQFNDIGNGTFKYATAANPVVGEINNLKLKAVSATTLEVYRNGVLAQTLDLTGEEIGYYRVSRIGAKIDGSAPLADGNIVSSVKLTDLANPSNSSIYNFDQASGSTLVDSGPLGNNGTLIGFTDPNNAWVGAAAPSATITGDLQPGASFTLNYSNYDAIPVSPVTITDSNNNSITVAVTINDTVTEGKHGGTATGTFPALPSSGTGTGLLFGNVTVELNT